MTPTTDCPRCGTPFPDGTECPYCGKLVPLTLDWAEEGPEPPEAPPPAPPPRPAPRAARVAPAPVGRASVRRAPPPTARAPAVTPRRTAPPPPRRPARRLETAKRYLPPVRLVWIGLTILVVYGGGLASGARALPWLGLVLAGTLTDLAFQKARFPHFRFPDAALATSLFLALILWPTDPSLALISLAALTVAVRHVARFAGHPWLNPAATGVAIGVVLFGMSTTWRIGVDPWESLLVTALGLSIIAWGPRTWRLPAVFFATFVPATIGISLLAGGPAPMATILTTGALSAQPLFYGLFMVAEPRTAPASPRAMPLFSAAVGLSAAALPALFDTVPSAGGLGVIAPFLALFVGNGLAIALSARHRRRAGAEGTSSRLGPAPAGRS